MDVAQALNNLFEAPSSPELINLPGPSTLTYDYLLHLVASVTYQPVSRAPVVPKRIAVLLTELSNRYIWWPTLSPDEVKRRYINDVDTPGDWDKVGVQPTEIEDNAITYLRRYRSAYVFCLSARVSFLTYSLSVSIQRELYSPGRPASFARSTGKYRVLCAYNPVH